MADLREKRDQEITIEDDVSSNSDINDMPKYSVNPIEEEDSSYDSNKEQEHLLHLIESKELESSRFQLQKQDSIPNSKPSFKSILKNTFARSSTYRSGNDSD